MVSPGREFLSINNELSKMIRDLALKLTIVEKRHLDEVTQLALIKVWNVGKRLRRNTATSYLRKTIRSARIDLLREENRRKRRIVRTGHMSELERLQDESTYDPSVKAQEKEAQARNAEYGAKLLKYKRDFRISGRTIMATLEEYKGGQLTECEYLRAVARFQRSMPRRTK